MKDASMSLGIYFEIRMQSYTEEKEPPDTRPRSWRSRSKDCRMLTLRNTQTAS